MQSNQGGLPGRAFHPTKRDGVEPEMFHGVLDGKRLFIEAENS